MAKRILIYLIILYFCPIAFAHAADLDGPSDDAKWLPTIGVTPGEVNPAITAGNAKSTICKRGYSTKSVRPAVDYTNGLKAADLRQPRYAADRNKAHYELDHLIPLEIGGAPKDPKNLWAQPWGKGFSKPGHKPLDCGAHVKDALENRLKVLVCSNKVPLDVARAAIAANWIAAYNRYVGKLVCD